MILNAFGNNIYKGLNNGIYVNSHGADSAAQNGHLDVLKFLYKNNVFCSNHQIITYDNLENNDVRRFLSLYHDTMMV
jgi:glutathionyl-hydroquinone reductase